MSFNIGYIVLPPGHGKSHLHNPSERIYEADTSIPCKSTPELKKLRTLAKISGDWSDYDKLWTALLNRQLCYDRRKIVVLVPSTAVGETAGWRYLGRGLFHPDLWEKNFQDRSDSAWDHRLCYRAEAARPRELFHSFNDVRKLVYAARDSWIVTVPPAQPLLLTYEGPIQWIEHEGSFEPSVAEELWMLSQGIRPPLLL
jgi:hypothetical protein